jgi:hypothetical protein
MEYLTHVLTFLAGLGAGWTLKVVISNRTTKNSVKRNVVQKNNTAGGDIVGGDMNKNLKG